MNRRNFLTILSFLLTESALAKSHLKKTLPKGFTRQNIAVIGAGISGITIAHELQQAGLKVTVYEAENRIGGRTYTSNKWTETPVDLGASWIHGINGNPIHELAVKNKVQLGLTSYDRSSSFWNSGKELSTSEEKEINSIKKNILKVIENFQDDEDENDISLRKCIEQSIFFKNLTISERNIVSFLLNSNFEHEYSGSIESISAKKYDTTESFSGEDALLIGGYQKIINQLAKNIEIKTGSPISEVHWTDSKKKIKIKIKNTDELKEFDRVVVTVPISILKQKKLQFFPELPSKKSEAMEKIDMGLLNKLYLKFPKVFWPKDSDWLEVIGQSDDIWAEWVSLKRSTNLPILLGFNAANAADKVEKWSDQETVDSAMQTLKNIFGNGIPKPIDYQITRWRSEPHFLGSYSFNLVGYEEGYRLHLAESINSKLYFAGEATSEKYFGTVHGAYLSALKVSNEILNSIK